MREGRPRLKKLKSHKIKSNPVFFPKMLLVFETGMTRLSINNVLIKSIWIFRPYCPFRVAGHTMTMITRGFDIAI